MAGTKTLEMSAFDGPVIETNGLSAPIVSGQEPSLVLSPQLKRGPGHGGFKGASIWSGIANLSTSIVGAGIMGLAATMKVLGLPLGIIVLLGMAFLTELSLEILVRTSTVQHVWSYSDLVRQEFNNRVRIVLDVCVMVNNIGICIVYLIITADVLSGTWSASGHYHEGLLVSWNGGVSAWWNSRYFVIFIVMLVFLVPLSTLKHVDSLHYSSAVAVALALVFVVITVVVAIIGLAEGKLPAPSFVPDLSNTNGALAIFTVIPVIATAYVCHFNVHPIYVELKDRSEESMLKVTRYSITLCTIIYFFTAIAGYLLFGPYTENDLLVNFDRPLPFVNSKAVFDLVRVSYVLHIILVFPVMFYSLRNITDDLIFPNASLVLIEDNRRFGGLTAAYMLIMYILAISVPNIWMAFTVTGATTTMMVGMIFPAILALRDQSGVIAKWERRASYFMIGLAIFVSITGIITSIINLVNSHYGPPASPTASAPGPN